MIVSWGVHCHRFVVGGRGLGRAVILKGRPLQATSSSKYCMHVAHHGGVWIRQVAMPSRRTISDTDFIIQQVWDAGDDGLWWDARYLCHFLKVSSWENLSTSKWWKKFKKTVEPIVALPSPPEGTGHDASCQYVANTASFLAFLWNGAGTCVGSMATSCISACRHIMSKVGGATMPNTMYCLFVG